MAMSFGTRWLIICAYAVVSFDSVLLSSSLDQMLIVDDSPVTNQSDIDAAAHRWTWNG